MPTGLAALLLATPVFGLQLQAPTLMPGPWFSPEVVTVDATLPLPELLQVDAADGEGETDTADADRAYAAAVRQRMETGQIHRALGIATWFPMTFTVIMGMIQYYNLYGFGAGQNDNPCATGSAVIGQDQCWGTPWPHLIGAAATTAMYSVTLSFSIGLLLNDPNEVLTGRGTFSDRMRAHAVLAIVHLAGMLAQTVIGIGLANNWFGDRANDYSTMQTVAGIHQAIGWTTWGAYTAAGLLMLL